MRSTVSFQCFLAAPEATNSNDILHRFFTSGKYDKYPVKQTMSPSMDIGISSNFERPWSCYDRRGVADTCTTCSSRTLRGLARLDGVGLRLVCLLDARMARRC